MATLTQIKQRFWDNDGTLLSGGKIYIYLAGTSTLTNSYTDATGLVANTNPVILDAKGEASIWTNGLVKINVLNSADVQVTGYPVDNVGPAEYFGSDGTATISAITTITSGYLNKVTTLSGTTYTVTLPAANTVQNGSKLEFKCTASGDITIARASSDTIGMSSAAVTSMIMKNGDTLTLVSNGSNQWVSLNAFIQSGTGAVGRCQNEKSQDQVNVFDFLSKAQRDDVINGTLLVDCTTAINNAITSLGALGGAVVFPSGKYLISGSLILGNGTMSTANTLGPVRLEGDSPVCGIGADFQYGGAQLHSSYAGPAIEVRNMGGWAVHDIFITCTTANTSTNAVGLKLIGAQSGSTKNVTFTSIPGYSLLLDSSDLANSSQNSFEETYIWLNPLHTSAVGVFVTGNTAFNAAENNSFIGLDIIPNVYTHVCIWLRTCNGNYFARTFLQTFLSTPAATGIAFDYANAVANFPNSNHFDKLDPCDNYIINTASPSGWPLYYPNTISGFTQMNGAGIPRITGLQVEKIRLTSNTSFYVATTGSNTYSVTNNLVAGFSVNVNTGMSPSPKWLTVQYAYNIITNCYDLNGYNATIEVADGTYSGAFIAEKTDINGKIYISGNSSTPANVIFSNTSLPFLAKKNAIIYLQHFTVSGATVAELFADEGGKIYFTNVVFGAAGAGGSHIWSQHDGLVEATGNYSITGGAQNHIYGLNGTIRTDTITVTLTGTPAFAGAFAYVKDLCMLEAYTVTYSGAATGTRYSAITNSVINTGGGGANYFPGNVAGATATGGQYV